MELKNISLNLKQSINHVRTLDLSTVDIVEILQIYRQSLYNYICYSNEQLGSSSEAYISKIELEKIDSLYCELINNFFPMAHTNSPLRNLQIVDKEEFRLVMQGLSHLERMGQDARELSEYLSPKIERLINP